VTRRSQRGANGSHAADSRSIEKNLIKKPSNLSIGNPAFGLRQSAFPQPSPKEWVLHVFKFG